jgi:glycosidase
MPQERFVSTAASPTPQTVAPVPAWAQEAIIYHIYPLGFLGCPHKNPGRGEPVPRLARLKDWTGHIAGLGCNTILLGPIFESETHGYDTIDLQQVDRRLGDRQTLRELIDHWHAHGFRVLLDGVFNHTGRRCFAFQDLRRHGAQSRYAGWYRVDWQSDNKHRDGFTYRGWHGSSGLPELKLSNREVRRYLFDTARFWLEEMGIDGWRLDAASDVPVRFWRPFREVCKTARPDCLLFGELVYGEYDQYLGPNGLDAATHYPFYEMLCRAMNRGRFGHLARLLRDHRRHPPPGALLSFMGNHDVSRPRTRLNNPAHFYPANVLMMGLPFIPCTYYGDELGLAGDKAQGDWHLRPPMPDRAHWPADAPDRYQALARLAGVRREHPIWQTGRLVRVRARGLTLSWVLADADHIAVGAINAGGEPTQATLTLPEDLAQPRHLRDVLDPHLPGLAVRRGQITLSPLYPHWGRLLVSERLSKR